MISKLTVKIDDKVIHSFLVMSIDGSDNAFRLVNSKGENAPASSEITEDRKKNLYFFDGVWVENGEVTTFVTLTKERKLKIGTLLSSDPT